MEVLIFKTNLVDHAHVSNVQQFLDQHPGIYRWNVDLNDCDNILRIEALDLQGLEIEHIIRTAGYQCEELY